MLAQETIHHPHFAQSAEYLGLFPQIDMASIGGFLGYGSGHFVFAYGDESVLKIPRNVTDPLRLEEKQKDIDTIQRAFPQFAMPTELVGSRFCPGYCQLQPRLIDFEDITPANLGLVEDDLKLVISGNRGIIEREGKTLDFIGLKGILKCLAAELSGRVLPTITNLVINEPATSPGLRIMDMNLLRIGTQHHADDLDGLWHYVSSNASAILTKKLLERRFGVLFR